MNDLYSIKLNVGETLTASRLATRARKTAHAKARARTEVSPNPFNSTRTNVLPPVMAKLDFVKQILKPKNPEIRISRASPASQAVPAWPRSTKERCPQKSGLINAHFYVGSPGREKRPSPTKYKSDHVKAIYRRYGKLKLTYRFANPRMPKVAFDPLPGGYLGGFAPQPHVFPNEVILKKNIYNKSLMRKINILGIDR